MGPWWRAGTFFSLPFFFPSTAGEKSPGTWDGKKEIIVGRGIGSEWADSCVGREDVSSVCCGGMEEMWEHKLAEWLT